MGNTAHIRETCGVGAVVVCAVAPFPDIVVAAVTLLDLYQLGVFLNNHIVEN